MRLDVRDGTHQRIVTIEGQVARLGRDPDCEVALTGDYTISRVHAVITRTAAGWQLDDAGSRNGTTLNGHRIDGPVALTPDDRIGIGAYVVVVRRESDEVVETIAADQGGPTRVRVETGLSARELEVLRLVCTGASDAAIAEALVVSVKTVHSHLDRIRTKTGCRRRPELIRFALDHGVA